MTNSFKWGFLFKAWVCIELLSIAICCGEYFERVEDKNQCCLQLANEGCQRVDSTQFVTNCHVRTIVIEVVKHWEFWADEMLQSRARFLACFTETPMVRGLVLDGVAKFSDILANSVFERIAVVLPQLDIQMMGDVLQMVSTQYFHSVEPFSIVDWLVFGLGATDVYVEGFPILSRVNLTSFISDEF